MNFRRTFTAALLATSLALVSGCDSSEERAEKFYQSGLEYLQAGDVDRALIEFRNVFKLNGRHREARRAYAHAEQDRGNLREAYGQYLRLAEQYPDDADALRNLASIAVQTANWDEARTQIAAAKALAPDDPDIRVSEVVMNYGIATENNDVDAMIAAARQARQLQKDYPDNLMLRRIAIDDLLRAQDMTGALAEVDKAIALAPEDIGLYATRLSIHSALNDTAAVEAGLIEMVGRFPDAPELGAALVRWYVTNDKLDKAETYLRDEIARKNGDQQAQLQLIRFLAEQRGSDAAVAELDKLIAAQPDSAVYRSTRAGFLFDMGKREEAIADMREILSAAPAGDDRQKIKVGLARMQVANGDPVGARALVEEVLQEDAGDVEAIKLKAGWLIMDDNVGEALTILREALDQNPRDAAIMTLMAQAYERDGNRDLMREMLSSAVEASGRAPDESLRYAQFLASDGKFLPAESVLIDALRIAPGSLPLLARLGELYVAMKDWPRAQAVADQISTLSDPQAKPAADSIRAAALAGQDKTAEALSMLEGIARQQNAGLAPKIAVVRARLANGQNAEALAYSEELLAEYPGDATVRFMNGSVKAVTGDFAGAEAAFRPLLDEDKSRQQVWLALYRALLAQPGKGDEAAKTLDQALAAVPDDGELLWAKAGQLERDGKIDEAITLYEMLYKRNSANPIVANNLASLLSTHRTDDESLARAEVIARRLRGSNFAPFQDTYGWIAYLRGNHDEALRELDRAAEGLPKEPLVQFHLAKVYLALDRKPEALKRFRQVVALAGTGDSRDFVTESAREIERLTKEGVKDAG